jgi:large subunit ribosomal protein L7/L12
MTETTEAKISESGQKVIDLVEKMSVVELAGLVKALEAKFGVTAAMPVMAAGAAAGAAAAAKEEKADEVTVTLVAAGEKKIQVLKIVREITGLGLKEAKDVVDNPPKPIKEKIPKAEADQIKAKLEAEGAKVEIK